MTAVEVRPMNETEARALTERIKTSVEHVWNLLLEAHERKAWEALGYESWRAYGMAEFGYSKSRCYELLNQAKVVRAIEEASGLSGIPEISAYRADQIKPHLADVAEQIRERVDAGEDPEDVVPEVVEAARAVPERKWSRAAGRPDLMVAKVVRNLATIAESVSSLSVGDYVATDEEIHELDQIIGALRKFRKSLRG